MKSWKNWAGTTICKPADIYYPTSQDDIKQIIQQAATQSLPIKVVGHGNSYNDNFHTTGILISLKKFNHILDIDTQRQTITIQAGAALMDIVNAAADKGLGFSSLGTNMFDNAAGACFTGHHGSGTNYGILSSFLESFDLLTPTGKLLHVKKGSMLYDALGVNLGAAGIVTQLTFKLEPQFKLHQTTYPTTLSDFSKHYKTLCNTNDHVKLIWGPHTQTYQCWLASRTDKSCDSKFKHWKGNVIDGLAINNVVHAGLLYLSSLRPSFVRSINKWLSRYFLKPKGSLVGWGNDIFYLPHLLKQDAVEYAIPMDKTQAFLMDLQQLVNDGKFQVQFPIEVRFVKQDNFWLSPAYQQDMCYVGTKSHLLPGQSRHYDAYFKAVSDLVEQYNGRPHWGKQLYSSTDYLQQVFPKWKEFWTLIHILDPAGLCRNRWQENLMYQPTQAECDAVKQLVSL